MERNRETFVQVKPVKTKRHQRYCNICRNRFVAATKFDRFCTGCKRSSELYHFIEWLPAA